MKLKFPDRWLTWLPRTHKLDPFTVYFVRTGEYVGLVGGPLTELGQEQMRTAAAELATRTSPETRVVLCSSTNNYELATQILATELGSEIFTSPFVFTPCEDDLYEIVNEYQRQGICEFIMVLDGTNIAALVRLIDGPRVEIGSMGPPHGSIVAVEFEVTESEFGRLIISKTTRT